MKILKKILVLTLIMITIIFSLVPPKVVHGYTAEQVGDAIASTAEDFYDRFGSETIYDCGISGGYYNDYIGISVEEFWGRNWAYKNVMTTGTAYNLRGTPTNYTDKYAIDCVGFVSIIMHRATSLGGSSFTYFAVPTMYSYSGISSNYERGEVLTWYTYTDEAVQRGDILCWEGHVAIAIGNGMMIDSANSGPNGQITKRSISAYGTPEIIVRIADRQAVKFVDSQINDTWYEEANRLLPDGSTEGNGEGVDDDVGSEYVPDVRKFGIGNSKQFYYNGMPISGEYLGKVENNWLIEFLENILDWLIGIMTLGYKIQIVGWTTIFQNLATTIFESITNSKLDQAITVENILFNEIQILDVNFFNFDTAGGSEITSEDIVYFLREHIASIYYSIRSISIILMLVVLIYVGIRMALSTVAGDKAKYKKLFFSWCVGFIVVMFIHYFMLVVIEMNEQIIGFMKPADNATIIYDEIRSYAYEISASKGWSGTIVYVFLVYYMIKLLIYYFKRVLIVFILSILAPILGIMYAIEMMKGKSKSFSLWMKEFSFNVLIQSIHVIVYCIFMNIIYNHIENISIFNLLPYSILMVLILNLMMKSEKTIKNIFGLKSTTMKDVADTVIEASSTLMTGLAMLTPIKSMAKNQIGKSYSKNLDNYLKNKYAHLENPEEKVKNSKLASEIQKEIDKLKAQEKQQQMQFDANSMKLARDVFSGLTGLVSAVPMTFEQGPVEGLISTADAVSSLNSGFGEVKDLDIDKDKINELLQKYNMPPIDAQPNDLINFQSGNLMNNTSATGANNQSAGRNIRTYNKSKNKKFSAGGTVASLATAGTTRRVKNIINDAKAQANKLDDPYQTARIELLYKLQAKVLEEEEKLNIAINDLKGNGFPPVFYMPTPGENPQTAAINMALKEQYLPQLEINLMQAAVGNPTFDKETVEEKLAEYRLNNGVTTMDMKDLEEVLSEIAQENDLDVGTDFEENLRDTIAKDLEKIIEKRQAEIEAERVKQEILDKVEVALRNNNWDEVQAESQIRTIVDNAVAEEVVQKLSNSELASVMTEAINKAGSLKNKPVIQEFEPIVKSAAKVMDINKDIAELSGKEKYEPDDLINEILHKDILD